MSLPKFPRTKILDIDSKKIKINPWKNITLMDFEGIYENNDEDPFTLIKEHLILPFIETTSSLTIIDYRYIFIELYKLSIGTLLDITFNCQECGEEGPYALELDKISKYKSISTQTIKTKDYIFNLKKFGTYCVDYKSNNFSIETLKYIASFVKSFETAKDSYEVTSVEEFTEFLNEELDNINFKELVNSFDKIQPTLSIESNAICSHCSNSTALNFKGIENFILKF